mmetsp:Transcript_11452/g.33624  ORF Transcript_11452/g.33624 Transcript_11452/m.33624 type:complete len:252 (+) Transcript_11452:46-801(+)
MADARRARRARRAGGPPEAALWPQEPGPAGRGHWRLRELLRSQRGQHRDGRGGGRRGGRRAAGEGLSPRNGLQEEQEAGGDGGGERARAPCRGDASQWRGAADGEHRDADAGARRRPAVAAAAEHDDAGVGAARRRAGLAAGDGESARRDAQLRPGAGGGGDRGCWRRRERGDRAHPWRGHHPARRPRHGRHVQLLVHHNLVVRRGVLRRQFRLGGRRRVRRRGLRGLLSRGGGGAPAPYRRGAAGGRQRV